MEKKKILAPKGPKFRSPELAYGSDALGPQGRRRQFVLVGRHTNMLVLNHQSIAKHVPFFLVTIFGEVVSMVHHKIQQLLLLLSYGVENSLPGR